MATVVPARFYIDASAFVKLLVTEPESAALEGAVSPEDELMSSDLLHVEAMRALRRVGGPTRGQPRDWLERVALAGISPRIRDRAAAIGPPLLRSPDAIHLATMDEAREGIDGLLSYDDHLIDAAYGLGFRVLSPR